MSQIRRESINEKITAHKRLAHNQLIALIIENNGMN